jgi:mercuric ion transport protein
MKRSSGAVAVGSAVGATSASIAAVLGALCCAGPAVVGVIGAGGALAAARLEPFRPYFLAASVVMLSFGFWRAYRPARAKGGACAIRTGRAARAILWASALITLGSALAPRFWT